MPRMTEDNTDDALKVIIASAVEAAQQYKRGATQAREYFTFADRSIVPTYLPTPTSRSDVDVKEPYYTLAQDQIRIFPVFGASMSFMRVPVAERLHDHKGIHVLPRVGLTHQHRMDDLLECTSNNIRVGVAIGVRPEEYEFVNTVLAQDKLPEFLSIDIAHGASYNTVAMMKHLADAGLNSGVIVGNVGSVEGYVFLVEAAKVLNYKEIIIKVGIGPGSSCTTRVQTGVGLGQLGVLEEIYAYELWRNSEGEERSMSIKTISDGGVQVAGDAVKALARSNGVMIGKFLASTDFEPEVAITNGDGEVIGIAYHGMASSLVGKNTYIEGGQQIVSVSPSQLNPLKSIEEGLRSAMTYVGALDLRTFRETVKFGVVTNASLAEGDIH